jgi:hypothetical protein
MRGIHHLQYTDGRIILTWIEEELGERREQDPSDSRHTPVASSRECGNEPSDSMKGMEFMA